MKQVATIFSLALTLLCLAAISRGDDSVYERVDMLVVSAHHCGCLRTSSRLQGLRETLGDSAELYVEHMDTQRFSPSYKSYSQLANWLKNKYQGTTFSAVVLLGDEALNFAIDYQDDLFPNQPKIFVGVDRDATTLPGDIPPIFTGFSQRMDFLGNLELAMGLNPTARNVVLLGDGTTLSRLAREQFERELSAFPTLNVLSIDGNAMTYERIVDVLRDLPADSLCFFLGFWRDRTGRTFPPEVALKAFAQASSAPFFVFNDVHLGFGAVGGLVVSPLAQGRMAGELTRRVLSGESVDAITLGRDVQTTPIVDYRAMQRFGLSLEKLPPDARVLHPPPPPFVVRHARELLAAAVVAASLGGLAFVVLKDAFGCLSATRARGVLLDQLDAVLAASNEAMVLVGGDGRIVRLNPLASKLTGWAMDEALGREVGEVFRTHDANTRKVLPSRFSQVLENHASSEPTPCLLISRSGDEHPGKESGKPIVDRRGEIVGGALVFHDTSEENHLQEELRHARRLEAIGKLAGGISHDFNNLLTSIIGNAELLRMSVDDDEELTECAEQIITSSSRAADLTGQLLTFSRKGRTLMKPVDIHALIDEIVKLLGHSIDRRIKVARNLECYRHWVRGNDSQLQNAILNLAINARDAMPQGGTLTFATGDVVIAEDNPRVRSGEILAGKYLELSVSDTGSGIEQKLRERVFEPFFTTKDEGKGTGLGLAVVYGTVRTHRGSVELNSWPGRGTTFSILLPVCLAPGSDEVIDSAPLEKRVGKGHLLVVDDEEAIRLLLAKMLTQLGYRASVCADGMEAVEYYARHGAEVDMVILDLMMPRMDGETAFGRIRTINPAAKILIVSGFSKSKVVDDLLAAGAVGFLPKPFHLKSICDELQKHLGSA